MADQIAPGTKVVVKVVKQPTNAAASKTITRILSKDRGVKRENERLRRSRASARVYAARGGREWAINHPKQRPVKGELGESGTVVATYDVIKDLGSVEKFVEVTPA